MSAAEREQRHQARLQGIHRIQIVVGRGDRARIDHMGTLLERARLVAAELRAHACTEDGLLACERLLRHAEEHGPGTREVVALLVALRDARPLQPHWLRAVPDDVAEDLLAVLDAWRRARVDLLSQLPGSAQRLARPQAREGATA